MKRVIVLTVVMCLLLCGCGIAVLDGIDAAEKEQKETTVDSLIDEYRNIPNGGILDVDHESLSEISKLMCETKYRVCGVLAEVEKEENLLGGTYCTAYLFSGKAKIYLVFEGDQELIEGEYVEVVGTHDLPSSYYLSLSDCTITDRGSAVRDRLESEE